MNQHVSELPASLLKACAMEAQIARIERTLRTIGRVVEDLGDRDDAAVLTRLVSVGLDDCINVEDLRQELLGLLMPDAGELESCS